MAAYGLYTHIASNKFRSMLLLAGLFVLVYVMVYAGALIAEVMINSDAPADYYLAAAARDLIRAFPYATGAALLWIVIAYFFHQSIVDAETLRRDFLPQIGLGIKGFLFSSKSIRSCPSGVNLRLSLQRTI